MPPATLAGRRADWAAKVHASPRAPGVDRLRIPGERGSALEGERLLKGLLYRRTDLRRAP